jgi:pimeloyl-ACP methyl ester carboxylesterase
MRTELPGEIQTWMSSGQIVEVDDTHVWYRTEGRSGPWLVCFHGFPTSSWDWHRLLPLLKPHYRVLVFDFPGYGLSEKSPSRNYSLVRQLDAVEALLRLLGIDEFDLLAHDMGASVACELLYRLEKSQTALRLRHLTLLNGGIYMDMHQALPTQKLLRTPLVGEVVARISSYAVFRHQYSKVYARPDEFDEDHYHQQWALLLNNDGRRVLAKIAGYMRERNRKGEIWTGPLHRTQVPLQLVWGRKDPIAVHAIAEKIRTQNPAARLLTLEDAAHYPQLESPGLVARAMLEKVV